MHCINRAILCPNRNVGDQVRELLTSPDGQVETLPVVHSVECEDEGGHFPEEFELISNTSPLQLSPADRGFQVCILTLSSYPGLGPLSCLFPLYFPTKICMHFLRISCNARWYKLRACAYAYSEPNTILNNICRLTDTDIIKVAIAGNLVTAIPLQNKNTFL
jgi:hypothetical protein